MRSLVDMIFGRSETTREDVELAKERHRHQEAILRPWPVAARHDVWSSGLTDEQIDALTKSIVKKITDEYDLVPKQKS